MVHSRLVVIFCIKIKGTNALTLKLKTTLVFTNDRAVFCVRGQKVTASRSVWVS